MIDQTAPQALVTMGRPDDDVFQQKSRTALGGADGEQRIRHTGYPPVDPQDEKLSDSRVVQNQTKASELLVPIRLEVGLEGKEIGQ